MNHHIIIRDTYSFLELLLAPQMSNPFFVLSFFFSSIVCLLIGVCAFLFRKPCQNTPLLYLHRQKSRLFIQQENNRPLRYSGYKDAKHFSLVIFSAFVWLNSKLILESTHDGGCVSDLDLLSSTVRCCYCGVDACIQKIRTVRFTNITRFYV